MSKFLRLPTVSSKTGLGRSQIYLMISQGKFPRQIKLSTRCSGWLESEIDAWIQKKVEEADNKNEGAK